MAKTKKTKSTASLKVNQQKKSEKPNSEKISEDVVSNGTAKMPTRRSTVNSENNSNLKVKMQKPLDKPLPETLALEKKDQQKVAKETKKIKKDIKAGTIKIKLQPKERRQKAEENRGLIYIAHIPHGFYEAEMSRFFKQFGKVTNVKVCRSRVSGNSKGYGYIEFQHPEVAKIAAESMNNYVMFKKRIVTEYVPYEKRPKHLFHGQSSNQEHTSVKTRRGKQKHSRNKIQDEETVMKKTKRSYRKLETKLAKLKNLGIQCNIIPVDVSDKVKQELMVEKKVSTSVGPNKENTQLGSNVLFKKPSSSKKIKSKNATQSTDSSGTSLGNTKSKKVMLTKSLDSVRTLIEKTSSDSHDEETQTIKKRAIKPEKVEKKILKKGIAKKEKKKTIPFNAETVKKIARELIRKRGTPLISLKPSKPRASKKK